MIDWLKQVGPGTTSPPSRFRSGHLEDAAARPGRQDHDGGADLAPPTTPFPHRNSALSSTTRPFVLEVTILQRERDPNVPAWLFTTGGVIVLIFTLMVIAG
ncbi:hypothetical protein I552_0005 [Mycobacterium xenopi 3993]|nr:hypothetical protein I552_0005 [Mycobacterium xenopi 3993]